MIVIEETFYYFSSESLVWTETKKPSIIFQGGSARDILKDPISKEIFSKEETDAGGLRLDKANAC